MVRQHVSEARFSSNQLLTEQQPQDYLLVEYQDSVPGFRELAPLEGVVINVTKTLQRKV